MTDPTKDPAALGGLAEILRAWRDVMPEQFGALLLSGVAGSFVRAVYAPETNWARRVLEGVAGVFSAMTLGWLMGSILDGMLNVGMSAYCASAFIMGEGGIAAVRGIRRALIKRVEG